MLALLLAPPPLWDRGRMSATEPAVTKVGPSRSFHLVVWLGFPVVGALAGGLLAGALDWVLGLSWAPMRGPLELVDELTGEWTLPILLGIGALLGLGIALATQHEVARIEVGPDGATLTQDGRDQHVAADEIDVVFTENGLVVVQDATGRRRAWARMEDLSEPQVRTAFTEHGHAWVEADPFAGDFSRWVPDAAALPAGANAVLVARQKALESNNGQDAEDFRLELAKLGVVVRDEGDRQFWRAIR